MNTDTRISKEQWIKHEVDKNKAKFGRWHSTIKRDSASKLKLLIEDHPKDDLEVLQHGNALANTGNYPVGTDACFNVGISGGCGEECFVFRRGGCLEHQQDIVETMDDEDIRRLILENMEDTLVNIAKSEIEKRGCVHD